MSDIFDLTGQLAIVGDFQEIFGSMDAAGNYTGGTLTSFLVQLGAKCILATNSSFPGVDVTPTISPCTSDSTCPIHDITFPAYPPHLSPEISTYTFNNDVPTATINTIKSIFWTSDYTTSAIQLLLQNTQTKSNLYKLSISIEFTWNRV
jgi:hypothetical protein